MVVWLRGICVPALVFSYICSPEVHVGAHWNALMPAPPMKAVDPRISPCQLGTPVDGWLGRRLFLFCVLLLCGEAKVLAQAHRFSREGLQGPTGIAAAASLHGQ